MDASTQSPQPIFYLQSVSALYEDTTALSDITLHIPAGQKLGLVGHSGAGKSTLLNLLYDQRPKEIAWVPHDYGLVTSLSVFHNVYMGQLEHQPLWYNLVNLVKPFSRPVQQVREILSELQLEEKIFEPTGQLSGGQQQRTAVARAMMQGGDILFADEPVSALDEQQGKLVLRILCQRFNTVVLAMHDIDLALEYCDRIVGLDHGQITLDELSTNLDRTDLLDLYGE